MQQHAYVPYHQQDSGQRRAGSKPARVDARLREIVYEPRKEQGKYDYCS